MGANQSLANNVANNVSQVQNEVIQTYVNDCGTTIDNNESFVARNCGTYTIKDSDLTNYVYFDQKCVQQINNNAQLTESLSQSAQQTANSLSKGFGFNESDANNLANNIINVSDTVKQNFYNACGNQLQSNIHFECDGTSQFIIDHVHLTNNITSTSQCQQNIIANTKVDTDIKETIAQSATAKSINNMFDWILIFIIVLAIAACFIMYYGEQFMIYLIIILIVLAILVIVGYIIYAKYTSNFPFKKKQ